VYPVSRVTGLLSPATESPWPKDPRGSPGDRQNWAGSADGPSIKKKHVHFKIVDEVVLGIPDLFGGQGD